MSAVYDFDHEAAMRGFNEAGEALARPKRKPEPEHRRTHQRVLRNSFIAGRERYEPLSHREARRRSRAVEMYMVKTQAAGVRSGARPKWKAIDGPPPGAPLEPLSYFDVQLYRLLCNAAVRFEGKVHPTYAWLAERMTGVATRTKNVVASIKRLRAHGLVKVQRRYVEVDGNYHQRGPQVEQTSNFYWVLPLPTVARRLLESFIRRRRGPDAPDDAEAMDAAQEAQEARWERDEAWARGRERSPSLAAADAKVAAALGCFVEELTDVVDRQRKRRDDP